MKDPTTPELVSALIDGELARDEARFAVRRVAGDADAAALVARWHVARSVLRGEHYAIPDAGFAAAVMQAVANEARPRSARTPWLKPLAGAAIAASVAMVALFAVMPTPTTAPSAEGLAAAPAVPALAAPTGLTTGDFSPRLAPRPVSSTTLAPLPAGQADIERYFLSHSGQATGFARGGFVPYVNIVATPVPIEPAVAPAEGGSR
jgi:sigma-E factor negative regulatory protein RseA